MKIENLIGEENLDVISCNNYAHIAEAFAHDKRVFNDLDKLYEIHKYSAYKLAKNSNAYNHIVITQGSIGMEIYRKKALGLILVAEENEELSEELFNIIKKYFKDLYEIVIKDKNILGFLAKKAKDIPVVEKSYIYLTFYLSRKVMANSVDIPKNYALFLLYMKQLTILTSKIGDFSTGKNNFIDENKVLIKYIYKRINRNKGNYSCYEDIYNSKDHEIKCYEKIIATIFDMEGFSISKLLNSISLTQQDINEIILSYTLIYKDNDIDIDKNIDRITNVLINGIIIVSLLKAYKIVKEEYFLNNKETMYLELSRLQDTIKILETKNAELRIENQILNNKVENSDRNLNNEIKKLKNQYTEEINLLRNKNLKLEKELEEEKRNKVELNELRNMLFKIESNYEPKQNSIVLGDIIKDKNIFIIGGASDWRKRIKEKYSNISTLDGFVETFDTKILNNADIVLFSVGFMNHATYYKAINYIKSKNIPFRFIWKTNIELAESEIAEELKNFYI